MQQRLSHNVSPSCHAVLQSFFGRVGPQEIEQRFTLGFIEVNDVLRRIDPATPEIKRRLAIGHDTTNG